MMRNLNITILALLAFLSVDAQQLTDAEYFWGTDPGAGNGNAMSAFDGDIDDAVETIVNDAIEVLEEGAQLLSIRTRDDENNWGPAFTVVVNVSEPISEVSEINVTAAEYFFNDDPGLGNGTPMLAVNGNFDEAVETIINEAINVPGEGVHLLSIRARDEENNWGPVFTVVVNVSEPISEAREINVTSAEYYFDDDPGPGNGTPMLAVNGDFSEAIEALEGGGIPSPVVEGIHVLWMRARDAENNWGPSFGVVVNMDTTITGFDAVVSGPQSLCSGDDQLNTAYSTQVTAGGTYNWTVSNGNISSGQGTANITVDWGATGPYSVQLEKCLGEICEQDELTVTINPSYDMDDELTICFGEEVMLGGAMQSQSGVYTDVYESVAGCDSTVNTTLTVLDEIALNIEATSTEVCAEESVTLTASGASNLSWSDGVNNGVPFVPTETTTYTVTGTNGDCSATASITIEVKPNPEVNIEASAMTVCDGEEVTLTASGADQLSWSAGIENGQPFVPEETTTYTATGTTDGCTDEASVTITVNPNPVLSVEVSAAEICAGEQVTLTASGADNLSWSDGVNNGEAFVPTESTTYTVTGMNGDCSATASITIEVNPNPEMNIEASATDVCDGDEVTLTASGADQISWNNGVENGQPFVPAETTTYTATGTTDGCSDEASVTITVNPNPVLSVEVSSEVICTGDEVTLTASGAEQLSWSDGVQNGEPFSPNETQSYSVTGTTNGCSSEATVDVTVNPLPDVTISGDLPQLICVYNAPIELTYGSPAGGTWSGPGVADGQFDPETAGLGNHTLTYSYTDENDCTAEAEFSLLVDVCTSVAERENEASIELYPNPATNICWVKISGTHSGIDRVALHDGMGRLIKMLPLSESDGEQLPVDVSGLAPGTYIVNAVSGDEQFHRRLVITR